IGSLPCSSRARMGRRCCAWREAAARTCPAGGGSGASAAGWAERRHTTHNKNVSGSAHFVRSVLHGLGREDIVSCQLNSVGSGKMSVHAGATSETSERYMSWRDVLRVDVREL